MRVCFWVFSSGCSGVAFGRASAGNIDEMFLWRRSTAEAVAPAIEPSLLNSSFMLAAERTHRRNPLDNFKRYDVCWRYCSSSVPYQCIMVCGHWLDLDVYLLLCMRRRRPNYYYSRTAYVLSVILLVIFTCAAIIGCAVLYHAQAKAYKSWTGTLDYAVYQANTTTENLRNFSSILSVAKHSGMDKFFMYTSDQAPIDEIQINTSANYGKCFDQVSSVDVVVKVS